jgi:hypothetical protein
MEILKKIQSGEDVEKLDEQPQQEEKVPSPESVKQFMETDYFIPSPGEYNNILFTFISHGD